MSIESNRKLYLPFFKDYRENALTQGSRIIYSIILENNCEQMLTQGSHSVCFWSEWRILYTSCVGWFMSFILAQRLSWMVVHSTLTRVPVYIPDSNRLRRDTCELNVGSKALVMDKCAYQSLRLPVAVPVIAPVPRELGTQLLHLGVELFVALLNRFFALLRRCA